MQLAAYASCPVVVVGELAGVGTGGWSWASTALTCLPKPPGMRSSRHPQRRPGLTVLHAWDATVYTSSVALSALAEPGTTSRSSRRGSRLRPSPGWAEKYPDVDVETRCSRAAPPTSSSTPLEAAELVVVGSRGRGGFRGLLLGSSQPQRPAPCALPGRRHPTVPTPRLRRNFFFFFFKKKKKKKKRTCQVPISNRSASADPTSQEAEHHRGSSPQHPPRRRRCRRFSDQRRGTALGHPRGLDPSRTPPLVSAWNPSFDLDTLGLATRTVEDHCRAILDAARNEVTATDPEVEVTSTAYVGPATTSLVEASLHADTVVVGSRGRRALPGFLLGATSLEVAAHAASPVVVVRDNGAAGGTLERVVVGVDGSPRSSDAVAYAFAFVSAHDLDLTVLHAFQVEYLAGVISPCPPNSPTPVWRKNWHSRPRPWRGGRRSTPTSTSRQRRCAPTPSTPLSTPRRSRTSWSWVAAGEAASAALSWGRSATVSFTTRTAPSPSSVPLSPPHSGGAGHGYHVLGVCGATDRRLPGTARPGHHCLCLLWVIPIAIVLSALSRPATSTVTIVNTTGQVITQVNRTGAGARRRTVRSDALDGLVPPRYPRWWFDFALQLARFSARVTAYLGLLTDRYPSTEDEQAIHLDIDYPDAQKDLNRWLPLVKWFLVIPHIVVLAFLAWALSSRWSWRGSPSCSPAATHERSSTTWSVSAGGRCGSRPTPRSWSPTSTRPSPSGESPWHLCEVDWRRSMVTGRHGLRDVTRAAYPCHLARSR